MKIEYFGICHKDDNLITETTDGQLNVFLSRKLAQSCLDNEIASMLEDGDSIDDYYIDSFYIEKSEKIKVHIVRNRKACDIFEEGGWEALEKASQDGVEDLDYDELEFNTPAEAEAYVQGIEDGNGWDDPITEIVDNKIEETN